MGNFFFFGSFVVRNFNIIHHKLLKNVLFNQFDANFFTSFYGMHINFEY